MSDKDKAPMHPQSNHTYYEVLPFAEYIEQLNRRPQEEQILYDNCEDLEDDDFDDI